MPLEQNLARRFTDSALSRIIHCLENKYHDMTVGDKANLHGVYFCN